MGDLVKKSLLKWSTMALLGIGAYFLGYFWGVKNLGLDHDPRQPASVQNAEQAPLEARPLDTVNSTKH